jgi:hypothetical protein
MNDSIAVRELAIVRKMIGSAEGQDAWKALGRAVDSLENARSFLEKLVGIDNPETTFYHHNLGQKWVKGSMGEIQQIIKQIEKVRKDIYGLAV